MKQSTLEKTPPSRPPEPQLLREIYRRWHRMRKHPLQMDWWRSSPLTLGGRIGGIIGFASAVLLIPFSQAILPFESKLGIPVMVTLLPFRPDWLAGLALLFLINSWFIDRHLAQRVPVDAAVRPWIAALRFLISGMPLLGYYAIPGWRWILKRRPRWAFREHASLPPLPASALERPARGSGWLAHLGNRLRRSADDANRRVASDLGLGLLLLGNAVVLGVALWFTTTTEPEPGQRFVVAGCGMIFHVVAFAGMLIHLFDNARRTEASRLQRYVYSSMAICWLVPAPYLALACSLGLLVPSFFFEGAPREHTLIHKAYSSRGSSVYLPLGLTFEEFLRRSWKAVTGLRRFRQPVATFPAPVEPSYTSDRLFWLYRVKSISLAFDAMALAWVLMWIADRQPEWRAAIDRCFHIALNASSALCLLGVLVMTVYFVCVAARSPGLPNVLDHHPYARFLAASQLALLAGLLIGQALYQADEEDIATTLKGVGLLGCLASFSAFLLRTYLPGGERIKQPYQGFLGIIGFMAVGMAGQSMGEEGYASGIVSWLTAFAITCPMWGILFGRIFLRWLLRPFNRKQVLSSEMAVPIRWTRAFLSATVVLPLGGLAIPAWIYLRHRKWPSWEKRYLKELTV